MQAVKDILPAVLQNLKTPLKQKRSLLLEKWGSIAGAKISTRTKPELGKNGVLLVWVEQAALAFELSQRYKQTLLRRAQAELGQEDVKTIRFCVGQLR
mgnify:CR=1 FL=1